jgi:predicted DNA-binding protein with PD1-like motif
MGTWQSYRPGRRLLGRLTGDEDLIQAVTAIGINARIATATVTVTGRVSCLTIGVYDPRQQVYVTRRERRPMEIVVCRGLLTTGDSQPFFQAHIMLADEDAVIGGRLFSETLATEAECVVEELLGPPADRNYDTITGQLALTFHPTAPEDAGS